MTELLEDAIAQLRLRPTKEQDEAAEVLLGLLARDLDAVQLTPEQAKQVGHTLDGLVNGTTRLATDEEVSAMWNRFGL